MSDLKKYVVEKVGYSIAIVSMTEQEASVIEKFLDWAETDDEFYVIPIDEYGALEWGGRNEE